MIARALKALERHEDTKETLPNCLLGPKRRRATGSGAISLAGWLLFTFTWLVAKVVILVVDLMRVSSLLLELRHTHKLANVCVVSPLPLLL